MSRNLESPVQTQMAVAALNHAIGKEKHGKKNGEARPAGSRRVFIQTETGCVLGMEIDRRDNAHIVKRRLQVALNVPIEESSLTFGDLVLKNDLSAVRGDSPLLLTRNAMHRSSSTPCISPRVNDIRDRDSSKLIEILGCSNPCARMKRLVKDVSKAIRHGIDPMLVRGGLGGAYYFLNTNGDKVAIVKPTDEEPFAPNNPKGFVGKALGKPGLKGSVRVGETGFREVAAYLLDHENFANVPPTALVKITHSVFNVNDGVNSNATKNTERKKPAISKIASFQQYIQHDFDASDYGTSSFPVSAVHRIGILDVRIFNTDRHGGNLLVRKVKDATGRFVVGKMDLIPIDHGLCLPENLEDPYFEWISWPQASVPFSEDELDYIANLDPMKDCDMLRNELPMIREACLRVLVLCTVFLKEAAAFGLSLAEIGEMMSRDFKGFDEEPSELEVVCMEARRLVAERVAFSPKVDPEDEDYFQFDIDCAAVEDAQFMNKLVQSPRFAPKGGSFRNPLSKLVETAEDDEEEDIEDDGITATGKVNEDLLKVPASMSKLSVSSKGVVGFPEHSSAMKQTNGSSGGFQVGNSRSADEQLSPSISFVKLADMGDEAWVTFLDIFRELLHGAFGRRKSLSAGSWQKQRLGTSCKF